MKKNEKYVLPWKCLQVGDIQKILLVKNEDKFLENIIRFFFVKLNTVNWCKLNKIAIVQCTDVTWVHVVMTPKSNYNFSIRNLRWQKLQCVQQIQQVTSNELHE